MDTSGAALKYGWLGKNNVTNARWGQNGGTVAGYIFMTLCAQIQVAAADYLQAFVSQDSGGSVNIFGVAPNYLRLQARYVAPLATTTGRVTLLFVGE